MAQEYGACGGTTWVRDDVSGRVGGKMHVSVCRQSDGRMRLELCKECKLYHCPFCQPSVYKPKGDYVSVWTHVEIHRMRALKHGEYSIHVCQLKCRKERHYHCPYCQKIIGARKLFETHMDKCAKMQKLPGIKVSAQPAPSAPARPPPSAPAPLASAQPPPSAPALSALMAGGRAILLVNLASPLQKTISLGRFLATPGPPLLPKSTSGLSPAPPQPPTQSTSTSDLLPTPPEPPAQPKSTANHLCAISEPPVIPESTSELHSSQQNPGLSPSPLDQLVEPTTTAIQPAALSDPPVHPTSPAAHPSSSTDSPVKQTGPILSTQRKIKCPLCNLNLNKKNLRIHNLRKHLIPERAKHHLKSQCVDSNNGVYAVAKAYKATAVPVHVIKKKSGSANSMTCEEDRCKSISDFRKRSSLPESQCPHLRSVDFCSTRANKVDLNPEVLEELVAKKNIRKDIVAKCLEYHDQASQNKAPLVALVDLGGSHCLYLSVFEPHMSEYCKSGRLFVTFTLKSRLWSCVCCRGRVPCLHRSLAKWFLFQTNRGLFSSNAKQDAPVNISELMTELPAGTGPGPRDSLKQTADYIYKQKKLPSMLPEEINRFESERHFQKNLNPAETVCQVCQGHVLLTEPVLITNRARVISLTGVTEDNSTFIRKCPQCQMVYRYQEWSEGLHNYNSHTILSLQLCVLLKNSIKMHAADGGAEVLERTIGVQSPCGMDMLRAYIHFEVLTNHNCQSEVMMELHQKGIFNMAGIKIEDLPESSTRDAETDLADFWDATCLKIILNSLETRDLHQAAVLDANLKVATVSAVPPVFTLAERKRLSKQRAEECHRAVARFLVKGLHPVSTVESPWFREMTELLNPKYRLPSRDQLINTLIPSLFSAEKKGVIRELQQVSEAALTCDLWTSVAHDHYRTLSLHFVIKGQMVTKVLCTKQVYNPQRDTLVAEQIGAVLKEFGVAGKVVAMTVDQAFNLDRGMKKLKFRKLRCFAQILSAAAQKVYTSSPVVRLASQIRAAAVWMKSSSSAQTVLQEKQKLFNLPQRSLLLDVQACWNSLYLMVERFVEQYAAVQATTIDTRVKQSAEKNMLETLSDDDHWKAVEFIRTMKPLYTSALCVSADKSPSCSQIFPILKKLETHFEPQDEDSLFTATLKEKVWDELPTCYQDVDTWKFLQESSAMDPRFKNSIDSDEIWNRVKNATIRASTSREMLDLEKHRLLQEDSDKYSDETLFPKRPRLTALEELFEDEDRALQSTETADKTLSMSERVQEEIDLYRKMPAVPTSQDALAWWWERRATLALLSEVSNSYLCVQASSTPLERVFSAAGDTISPEMLHILPEKVDMQIFLQKNSS